MTTLERPAPEKNMQIIITIILRLQHFINIQEEVLQYIWSLMPFELPSLNSTREINVQLSFIVLVLWFFAQCQCSKIIRIVMPVVRD